MGKMKKKTTLQEAIKFVVEKLGPTKPKQVAWVINNSNLYQKRDLSEVQTSQIYARISKYPDLLYINEEKCVCIR